MSSTLKIVSAALIGATAVAAHGHVTNIVVNGVSYQGYDINKFPYETNPPTVVAWTASDTDNGFVDATGFSNGDIICHKNATNAKGFATAAAGDNVFLVWDTWPESHKGPVMDYLASCGDDCSTVDKTKLEFFKIDAVGLVDDTTLPGNWGSDQLIANNNSWLVQIPSDIAPGNYVLRHEILALHSAGSVNGAQFYPQCFNLQITGSGTNSPAGVAGESLYTATDPGVEISIYTSLASYPIPGPAVIAGATNVKQTSMAATATSSATVGAGNPAAPAPTVATSAAAVLSSSSATAAPSAAPTSADSTPATTSQGASTAAAAPSAPVAETSASGRPRPTGTHRHQSGTGAGRPRPTGKSSCGGSNARRHARDVQV